jgi:CRISPR/Cas system CMR-associated protein Cmr1 (group 7 of RAMP superfamily)
MKKEYQIKLVTPLFSCGANQDSPEIRAPSIRGQLHWWFRALGGTFTDEKEIFGGISNKDPRASSNKDPRASRVVVRVINPLNQPEQIATLPHKQGGPSARKPALKSGSFTLCISDRLGGLNSQSQQLLERAINAWLLMGSLGLRSTRGGGALQAADFPESVTDYKSRVSQITEGTPVKCWVLEKVFNNAEEARKVITDTLGGDAFRSIDYPLGAIKPKRKTSPLRLTVRHFSDGYRIIAVWDGREAVTGNKPGDLEKAASILDRSSKRIGTLLLQAMQS